jgi:hypothetical protein
VSVLCVLCVFVVKNPLSVAVLHRTRTVAARMSTTPCINRARYSLDVRYRFGAFSALNTSPNSVGRLPLHDMHIFDVNKCTYLYRQLPSSIGRSSSFILHPSSFILHPSSFILHPSSSPKLAQNFDLAPLLTYNEARVGPTRGPDAIYLDHSNAPHPSAFSAKREHRWPGKPIIFGPSAAR